MARNFLAGGSIFSYISCLKQNQSNDKCQRLMLANKMKQRTSTLLTGDSQLLLSSSRFLYAILLTTHVIHYCQIAKQLSAHHNLNCQYTVT